MPFDKLDEERRDALLRERVTRAEPEKALRCVSCGTAVTREKARIDVEGAHAHRFTNPHGIRFEIGCFADAEGCAAVGEATEAWTWFRGYAWRVGVCRGCARHLGWHYTRTGDPGFFGLILDRLAPDE